MFRLVATSDSQHTVLAHIGPLGTNEQEVSGDKKQRRFEVTQAWDVVEEGLPGASDAGGNSEGQELHLPAYT